MTHKYDPSYYQKHLEKLRKYYREYYHKHKKVIPEVYKRMLEKADARRKKLVYENKLILVSRLGGKCSHCDYSRNLAALEVHHPDGRDPLEVELYQALCRKLTEDKIRELIAGKVLLCSNCHKEEHHPDSFVS